MIQIHRKTGFVKGRDPMFLWDEKRICRWELLQKVEPEEKKIRYEKIESRISKKEIYDFR